MSVIKIEVPKKLIKDFELSNKESLKKILERGLLQIKIDNVLKKYQNGEMSIGFAAKMVGISKQNMIKEAYIRGIVPDFSEKTLKEETGK